ncbi:DmsE family decaheme c-type cytochrome [Desulfopila inferna]|uniref:DmsE family decaheme c-type cytochrome n=1 Tax=Desulfopila inferna TaxID=468528 RepID=UPI001966982D|nr:DmsE family decaheme c-type cytochrome [Desulfopila inferna]MBM9606050.1 DmsE family decaheme c-type cytochrome [Desulfopila inferna]
MNRKRTFLTVIPLSLLLLSLSLFFSAAGEAQETEPGGFIGAETCIECHESQYESYARSIHSRESIKGPQSQDACETCHGAGALHVEKGGGRDVDIFTFDDDVDPEARSAKCLTCHQTSEGMDLWSHSAHSRNEVSCDGCHDLHVDGVQKPNEPEVCFNCHRDIRVQVSKRSHHPILEGKVNCSSCHSPHGSLSKNLVKADDTQQLCHSCHTDKRGPYIYEHPPVEENCLTCHTSHGSRHLRLLTEKVPNLCQDCHDWSRHPGTPYDAETGFIGESPSNRFFARSCLNCHGTIHGSNTFENHRLTR